MTFSISKSTPKKCRKFQCEPSAGFITRKTSSFQYSKKTSFYDPFTEVTIRRKSGHPSSRHPIPKVYTKKLPISTPKIKDLFTVCEKLMIPHEHHPYYHFLKSEETA
jgi:hypothetical protein